MIGWLEGKVALLSGGGSGIGRAVVDAFIEAGASVCVLESDASKCEQLADAGIAVVHGDATSPTDNRRAVREVLARFGHLDTLATFVGIFDLYTPLLELRDEHFDASFREIFDLNVVSVLHAVRAAAAALRDSRGNVVITCSSSSFYPGRGGTLYVASKFALRGAVVQLARELAPDVRVNGVAPGGTIATDLRGLASLDHAQRRLDDRPGRKQELERRTPLGLALTPADHAAAYVYLASARAPGITGEVLRSDGGLGVR